MHTRANYRNVLPSEWAKANWIVREIAHTPYLSASTRYFTVTVVNCQSMKISVKLFQHRFEPRIQ